MNVETVITTAVGVVVAVAGWIFGHWLNAIRDRKAKRRELQVQHLIGAFQQLVKFWTPTDIWPKDLQSALSDIQLFDTPKQIQLALELLDVTAQGQTLGKYAQANEKFGKLFDELITNLRDQLREELDLGKVDQQIKFLSFRDGEAPPNQKPVA